MKMIYDYIDRLTWEPWPTPTNGNMTQDELENWKKDHIYPGMLVDER